MLGRLQHLDDKMKGHPSKGVSQPLAHADTLGCSRSSLFHGSSLPEDQPLSMLTCSKVGLFLPACNEETVGEVHPGHILQTN